MYNLSRMRESATERYKGFHIPVNWMLDTGYVSLVSLILTILDICFDSVDEYNVDLIYVDLGCIWDIQII